MSESSSLSKDVSVTPTQDNFGIMLPCETWQFGEFISGLLGKPQTIEKHIKSIFEIRRQDIVNTFYLVDQRIHQQNDSSLVQFTVRIIYDDDSSVLLNSLADFENYTEIRPITSVGVVLSWTYLIKFKNKQVPEKQEISLTFRESGGGRGVVIFEDGVAVNEGRHMLSYSGGVLLRVSHTERTWGVDIESLLTGHIKTLSKKPTKTELFTHKNSGYIGLTIGSLFFLGAILGVFITSSKFIDIYLNKINTLSTSNPADIPLKLNFLIEVISTGAWPRFIFAVIVFLVISLILSIALGGWVSSKANNLPSSYILLSKMAEELRVKDMERFKRDWNLFILSIIVSIAAGIVSNIVFTKYFGGVA